MFPRLLAASAVGSFICVWAWIIAAPMAFMDTEYASWQAKLMLLDRCDLGDAIILGDSRAAADILPARLPIQATNLAVGGGEAIEALAAASRAVECPAVPKLVIVSIDPGHFIRPDLFWERSVRFGLLSAADLDALRDASAKAADPSVYEWHHTDGLPSVMRDWLYEVRFPPLFLSSLIHGGGLLRWDRNLRTLHETLAARGHYYFGTGAGSASVAADGHIDAFKPLPVLDLYFDRLLALLNKHGIPTLFIAMPINEATWSHVDPAVRADFAAYLADYERRYPTFHVAPDIMPHWPDRFFGDQFCHLNPEGAERFSAELAQRLQDAPPSTQNDAQNGWLSETGADASARVVPISKRGS